MHPLLKQYQDTVLGQLKTKVSTCITHTVDRLPTDKEMWSYLMGQWKENAVAARIYFHLIHSSESHSISIPNKFSRQSIRSLLRDISGRAPVRKVFVEGRSSDLARNRDIGCLLLGYSRSSGEPVYYAAVLTPDEFPVFRFIYIVPSKNPGQSIISEFEVDGWHHLTPGQAGHSVAIRMAMVALQTKEGSHGVVRLPADEIVGCDEGKTPLDPECGRLLKLVFGGRMFLTKGTVPRASVRLFDPDFALALEESDIRAVSNSAEESSLDLLVYWDGKYFVSSDDYHSYRACQSRGMEFLPVVIMGEFPAGMVCVARKGGRELLPPVIIRRKGIVPGLTEEFREWQKKDELLKAERLPPPADLMASWIVLAELLSEDDINECELHNYFKSYPLAIGAEWNEVQSEVTFGGQYRADLMLRKNRALPEVRLIELEKSTHRLFTRQGQETAEVTHAVKQVSDWMRWWRQNPANPIVVPSRSVTPEGMVVIGRSRHLSESEREILAHNNQGRNVKVVTYDELLDDFGTLIQHRLDDKRVA